LAPLDWAPLDLAPLGGDQLAPCIDAQVSPHNARASTAAGADAQARRDAWRTPAGRPGFDRGKGGGTGMRFRDQR
jgi:hypothetical protein